MRAARYRTNLAAGCLFVAGCVLVAGCTVVPTPLDTAERDRLGAESRERLFADQEPPSASVSLAEATARAVKYYADLRARMMEQTAAEAQLGVARFDMLPRLTANAGYTTRDNDAFGYGFTPDGTVALNPTASVPRSHNTQSVAFAWNILDFGVSYYRAKQLADQVLIAQERRRKSVQTLVYDVRQAWWRAEAAQRLMPEIDALLDEVQSALEKTRVIEARKLLPPMQIVTLRRALLDTEQEISFRRQDLAQSRVELAALINVPPGTRITLQPQPPQSRRLFDLSANLDGLEAAALRNRPEMAEEAYRGRISEADARKAILQILPGISFDAGSNYDSNPYLVNNTWTSAGFNVAFNLVKVFSLPALNRSEEAQKQADEAKRLAMAMAILAQTRIATVRYTLVAHEYGVWDDAARDDELVVEYLGSSAEVGIDSELELIRAKARAMLSKIKRDLSYANVEASVARIFNSVGFDVVREGQEQAGVVELTQALELRLAELQRDVFSPRVATDAPTVMVAAITGMERASAGLLGEGIDRVLRVSKVRIGEPGEADLRMLVQATLLPSRQGVRAARVHVRVLEGSDNLERFVSEFRTTLSEPVDDEQLRVLGEGAAYRVVGWLIGSRSAQAAGRHAQIRGEAPPRGKGPAVARQHELDGDPFELRLDPQLLNASRSTVSRLDRLGRQP